MLKTVKFLTKNYHLPMSHTLQVYREHGGYRAAEKALQMSREEVVQEVKKANLRGRGGAGFPMGVKWGFMPKQSDLPCYLVVNADEGEPGTFKDRTLMELDPHRVIEGCVIGCYGIGAHVAYIYVRHELHLAKERLWQAIDEARQSGILGPKPFGIDYPIDVFVQTGAGAYICGEESALLESLEGKRGQPRLRPPFPAQSGVFSCPTTVNNLESIATCPTILDLGGEAFSKLSSLHERGDGGCRLFGVSGHVQKPGIYEACVGLTLRELVYELGGGIAGDGELLGVIPGGSSCPIVKPSDVVHAPNPDDFLHPWHAMAHLDVPIGVDTMKALGTMAGTCCAIVLSDRACPVLALHNLVRFYKHESCGQCTPCREGMGWMMRILDKIVEGKATIDELNQLHEIASNVMGNTICAFGEGASMPILGFLRQFRPQFEQYVLTGGASSTGRLAL